MGWWVVRGWRWKGGAGEGTYRGALVFLRGLLPPSAHTRPTRAGTSRLCPVRGCVVVWGVAWVQIVRATKECALNFTAVWESNPPIPTHSRGTPVSRSSGNAPKTQ